MYEFCIQKILYYLEGEYVFIIVNKQWVKIYKKMFYPLTFPSAVDSPSRIEFISREEILLKTFILYYPPLTTEYIPPEMFNLYDIIYKIDYKLWMAALYKMMIKAIQNENLNIFNYIQFEGGKDPLFFKKLNSTAVTYCIKLHKRKELEYITKFPTYNKKILFKKAVLSRDMELIDILLKRKYDSIEHAICIGILFGDHELVHQLYIRKNNIIAKNIIKAFFVLTCLYTIVTVLVS